MSVSVEVIPHPEIVVERVSSRNLAEGIYLITVTTNVKWWNYRFRGIRNPIEMVFQGEEEVPSDVILRITLPCPEGATFALYDTQEKDQVSVAVVDSKTLLDAIPSLIHSGSL